MPGSEIIVPHALAAASTGRPRVYSDLHIAPAAFELDDTEIDLASTNSGNSMQSDWEKRTILCEWLDKIDFANKFDFIVFDCPPATKIVSQNALVASEWYVIPVIPDALSSRGVSHFKSLVEKKIDSRMAYLRDNARVLASKVPASFAPTTKLAAIVPSMAKAAPRAESGLTDLHTSELAKIKQIWGNQVIDRVIRNKIGVAESMQYGLPVWVWDSQNINAEVHRMMTEVCEQIMERIDGDG